MREVRYLEIAADLRKRVEAGEFSAGGVLPSEADLTRAYGASRVTVRKALESLRDAGLVDSRQGFGWFVAVDRVRQSLAQLSTIERDLAERGVEAERQILDFAFVAASAHVRGVLGVDQVLRVRRLNLADGAPFARVTVWCPAELGASLSRADVSARPFYELLPVQIGGATQTIGAALAESADANVLAVPVGSPVLRCERVTRDVGDHPVLLSVHVFPAHLTEFVVDLPSPASLSLVE